MDVFTVTKEQIDSGTVGTRACEALEAGNIVVLPDNSLFDKQADIDFLLGLQQNASALHKNVAYKPAAHKVTGATTNTPQEADRLLEVMSGFSKRALALLGRVCPPYAGKWKTDYASYRPFEEQGRDLPLKQRNDLMHVDAFPSRPTRGGGILRLFTQINPNKDRVWRVSGPFEALADKYALQAGLREVKGGSAAMKRAAAKLGRAIGINVPDRTAYDQFMLGFHDFLKGNEEFQHGEQARQMNFRPNQVWMCYTDVLAHSVLSGQYALEQTVIVPPEAKVKPDIAPVSVLERIAGFPLTPAPRPALQPV
ncbi:MAG: Kdo hydroxylase family protein [Phycisphaeraceae bacterium]|nr:Kdo hydroxylase family protein [Phycisphaeraceae bacterium]